MATVLSGGGANTVGNGGVYFVLGSFEVIVVHRGRRVSIISTKASPVAINSSSKRKKGRGTRDIASIVRYLMI